MIQQPNDPKTLLEGKPYTKHTDVQETWKKFGWTPVNGTAGTMDTATIAVIDRRN